MNVYATLAQLRTFLESGGVTMSVDDDAKLISYLMMGSRLMDQIYKRRFYPLVETRTYDYQNSTALTFDDDLLEVTTLAVEGTTITASEYLLYPLNKTPKGWLEMKDDSTEDLSYSDRAQGAITVLGMWGYHDDWASAWADSQDEVKDNPLTAAATSLTVNDADGGDENGLTPRFAVGDLLKIEDEYLAVTAVNTTTQVLTVKRGVNGTTAAAHIQNTTIYTFTPFSPATSGLLDLAKWFYEHRKAAGGIIALPSLEGTAIRTRVEWMLAVHNIPERKFGRLMR